jgi:hypothetical protein
LVAAKYRTLPNSNHHSVLIPVIITKHAQEFRDIGDEFYETFTSNWDKLNFTQRKNVDSTENVNERGSK